MSEQLPVPRPGSPTLSLLVESFLHLTGQNPVVAGDSVEAALWLAPRVIVAHGTETDPIFSMAIVWP
ncbi:MAG: MEKHLA domain-containing protein [Oxalobacteraceae bacterium]|nr:MEKHLA domain-containing protein [Oxalobacteraceae bacterium]